MCSIWGKLFWWHNYVTWEEFEVRLITLLLLQSTCMRKQCTENQGRETTNFISLKLSSHLQFQSNSWKILHENTDLIIRSDYQIWYHWTTKKHIWKSSKFLILKSSLEKICMYIYIFFKNHHMRENPFLFSLYKQSITYVSVLLNHHLSFFHKAVNYFLGMSKLLCL